MSAHKTPLIRTQDEIAQRAKEAQGRDFLGFESTEYVLALDAEHAKPFLKEDADWDASYNCVEIIDITAKDYMTFWLEKIENERGISVCRATAHFIAWKWLLGHADADTFPGSIHGRDGGWYQRDAYNYIKTQMDTGEWDRLTKRGD